MKIKNLLSLDYLSHHYLRVNNYIQKERKKEITTKNSIVSSLFLNMVKF